LFFGRTQQIIGAMQKDRVSTSVSSKPVSFHVERPHRV
jgi:hypothetical protein